VPCLLGVAALSLPGVLRAAPPSAAETSEALLLDGLAAVLGGTDPLDPPRPILQSDVELCARLALLPRDSERALFAELPRSLLRATLDQLIGEQLIAIEAERVQIAAPRPADIARELSNIEREAGGRRALVRLLARLDASQVELEAMALRRAVISAFLRANLEGVNVATDAEVDARLRAAGDDFAGESRQSARAAVRALLEQEALTRNIEHWVRVLRARTRVRVLAYASP
jgi:hypothetical protein